MNNNMEISNEIKAKVFAPYLGIAWVRYNNPFTEGMRAGILTGHDLNRIEHNKEPLAIIRLKPLSEITNEDAIEVDKIISPKYSEIKHFHTATRGKVWIRDIFSGNQVSNVVEVYQFLQSKGYDLPQYLLGGKTLQECGLAIYE
jgi:hypothetical protein